MDTLNTPPTSIELPLTVSKLAELTGYSVHYLRLAKRAGFKHEFPGDRSTLTHLLDWLRANPEFSPNDYRGKKFGLRQTKKRPRKATRA